MFLAKSFPPLSTARFAGKPGWNRSPRLLLFSRRRSASLALLLLPLAGCGYQVAGKTNALPPGVKVIAIPAFTNQTHRFRIEQMVTSAVTRAFIERTSFQVTHTPAGADALLKGSITSVEAAAVTFDPNTGRATTFQVSVTASVELIDLHTHKALFKNPKYVFREEYQISPNAAGIFEEDQPALERVSRAFANELVTDIVENF